jgi:quinol-cytochrome oxidoreductase complex cytochrome b subunit
MTLEEVVRMKDALEKVAPIAVIVLVSIVVVLALGTIPPEAMQMQMSGGDDHGHGVVEIGYIGLEAGAEADEHQASEPDEHVHEASLTNTSTKPASESDDHEASESDDHEASESDDHEASESDDHEASESDDHEASESDDHGHETNGSGLDEHELELFRERVQEEAYAKAERDKVTLIVFGVLFVLVYVSFARIEGISDRLRGVIDWYTVGIVTGIILVALVIPSGIIITFYYMPTATGVYDSVEAMTRNAVLAFSRNLHNWSSELFVILMILHAARAVSTRTYMRRHKIIWLTGAFLLIAGFLAFLSGTFMRGDQEALEGFAHMMFSFTLIPLGQYISNFFSGELALMKLTAVHVGATTLALVVLTAFHVLMRKVHVHVQRRWKKAVVYSLVLTVFLVIQSVFIEAPFVRGMEAGPTVSGVEITKPPWPIYFMIAVENLVGATGMVYSLLVFLPLIIFPYLIEFLPLEKAKRNLVGDVAFYGGTFLMLAISYWAAAGTIITHIF